MKSTNIAKMLFRIFYAVCILLFLLALVHCNNSSADTAVFYINDGVEYATVEPDENGEISFPADPVKTGYVFEGWIYSYDSLNCVQNYLARWVPGSFTVFYDLSYSEEGIQQTYRFGDSIEPPDPQREGYTFLGWSGTIPATMPSQNLTYYAQWSKNSHWVKFYDGDELKKSNLLDYGSEIIAPTIKLKEGHTFKGWDSAVPNTVPDYDTEFRTVWAVNEYTISFDTDGAGEIKSVTKPFGTVLDAPPDPQRRGYSFQGWSVPFPETMPSENLHLTATWNQNSYKLTIDKGNGTEEYSLHYLDNTPEIKNPDRTGHKFLKWDKTIPAVMPDTDVTVTAVWVINNYVIRFDTSGGSQINPVTVQYGATVELPDNPTRKGHSFAGWLSEVPVKMPANDLLLTAEWNLNSYTIYFDSTGGTPVSPIVSTYGSSVSSNPIPERTGFTFDGWDPVIPETVPAEDVICKAKWSAEHYTVVFRTGISVPGLDVIETELDYGEKITAPNPTREGYTFLSWNAEIPETMPASRQEFEALWQINSYTVYPDTGGGEYMAPFQAEYGSAVSIEKIPFRTGFTFAGWEGIPDSMPAQDVSVTAKWERNSYTVEFDLRNGSDKISYRVDYGRNVPVPQKPEKDGHTFLYWDMIVPEYMPATDLKFRAIWSVNSYKLSFDSTGGSEIKTRQIDFGTKLTNLPVADKEGHTFLGWLGISDTMPSRDVTLTAEWKTNTYDAVFRNGTESVTVSTEYGNEIEVPKFSRSGYSMTWNVVIPETMPARSITAEAVWSPNIHRAVFVDGSRIVESTEYGYGDTISYPIEQRKGYDLGWSSAVVIMPDEDLEIHTVWTPSVYSISFDTGDEVLLREYAYGVRIDVPDIGTKEGLSFAGWSEYIPQTMPDRNLSVRAVWVSSDTLRDNESEGSVAKDGEENPDLSILRVENDGFFGNVGIEDVYMIVGDGFGDDDSFTVSIPLNVPDGSVPVVWVMCGGEPVREESAVYEEGLLTFKTESPYLAIGFEKTAESTFPTVLVIAIAAVTAVLSVIAIFVAARRLR